MFVPQNPPAPLWGRKSILPKVVAGLPFKARAVYPSARVALLVALREQKQDRNIWLPAFLCRSILKPIHTCNLTVRYYDVDRNLIPVTKSLDFQTGDYFLMVHFFGIYQTLDHIHKLCREKKMVLIEDCAHTLPDPRVSSPAGTVGDITILSLRKLLPVIHGGLLVEKQQTPHQTNLTSLNKHLWLKKRLLALAESLAFRTRFNFLPIKLALRGLLGTVDGPALSGRCDCGVHHLKNAELPFDNGFLEEVIDRRKKHYYYLHECLKPLETIEVPFPVLPSGSCPQAFPIILKSPMEVITRLNRFGIEAGVWPGREKMPVPLENYPGTQFWHEHLLLLPIHHELQQPHLDYIVDSLQKIMARQI